MENIKSVYSDCNGCLVWNGWKYYKLDWRCGFFGTASY